MKKSDLIKIIKGLTPRRVVINTINKLIKHGYQRQYSDFMFYYGCITTKEGILYTHIGYNYITKQYNIYTPSQIKELGQSRNKETFSL